jgi:hypothetical protein
LRPSTSVQSSLSAPIGSQISTIAARPSTPSCATAMCSGEGPRSPRQACRAPGPRSRPAQATGHRHGTVRPRYGHPASTWLMDERKNGIIIAWSATLCCRTSLDSSGASNRV